MRIPLTSLLLTTATAWLLGRSQHLTGTSALGFSCSVFSRLNKALRTHAAALDRLFAALLLPLLQQPTTSPQTGTPEQLYCPLEIAFPHLLPVKPRCREA